MGSTSDWDHTMSEASKVLKELNIPHESKAISAHRAPDMLFKYLEGVEEKGIEVIIAGAGGAAHLPGVCAAKVSIPVLGVPVESKSLGGLDSLLSIAQMPGGIPVGTFAIGPSGAKNAGLFAAAMLANKYPEIKKALKDFRAKQTKKVQDAADSLQ